MCERNHKYTVSCARRGDACRQCGKEDEDLLRRMRRDLKLEAERLANQRSYEKSLQDIEDELDRQRRILKYDAQAREQKESIARHQKELESLKQTVARTAAAREQREEQVQRNTADKARNGSKSGDGSSAGLSQSFPPESAEAAWDQMKKSGLEKNEALDELMEMMGLQDVKKDFLRIKNRVDTALRQQIPLSTERFSCSLLGNPGTGKTTVARIYARFLVSVGIIPGSKFIETTGSKLASMGVKGCQTLLEDILNDGGGVLFIDEAYQLANGNNPGGSAVLDFLLAEIENLTGKVVFVLAGYSKQMEDFFAHNPGLPSRFPIEMKFDDYEQHELLQIIQAKIGKKFHGRMKVEDGLDGLFCRILSRRLAAGRGRNGFGNARAVENKLSLVYTAQAERLHKQRRQGSDPDDLFLTKEDLIGPEPSAALGKSKAWDKLQSLTGLKTVKETVQNLVSTLEANYRRELAEEPPIEYSLNRVFLGSPGTGKTTVAKLYGQILVDLGMLSKGEVIIKNPSDFVGSHLGQSEKQTKGILASAFGKVLVIDEAYGLYGGSTSQGGGGSSDPYKAAVIDTIVAEVQSTPGEDRCVLLLGYKQQMEEMFQNVNDGLRRRFPTASAFTFEDFTKTELEEILDLKLRSRGYKASELGRKVVGEMLERARNRPNFGNGGEVDILLDQAILRKQRRCSNHEARDSTILDALDFDEDFARAERSDTDVARLFQGDVGREKVIALLQGFQSAVRGMKEVGLDPKDEISFNFLFRGPPGTGKTTTAGKMGKVFYDMGFLATAEVVECSSADLLGQYVGQTAPKVQQMFDEALGRVLFVDEAYRLADGPYAKEATDEIVNCITNERYQNKLIVILAGYDKDINGLISTNPGLSSRFPEVIDFAALSPPECLELLTRELKRKKTDIESKGRKLDMKCLEQPTPPFRGLFVTLFSELGAQPNWASARDVKTIAQKIARDLYKSLLSGSTLTIDEPLVKQHMTALLEERKHRNQHIASPSFPPARILPQDWSNQATATMDKLAAQASSSTATMLGKAGGIEEPQDAQPPEPFTRDNAESLRDAGVSDEDWHGLQQDRIAEQEKEVAYRALQKEKAAAQGAARDALVRRLLEEEDERKKVALKKEKLMAAGLCPAGFAWIEQDKGYRCAGGSRTNSHADLEKL